jgi:hypothetical protein
MPNAAHTKGHPMLTPLFRLTALAIALASSQVSLAATAYNNGAPNGQLGTGMSEFRVADNFTLSDAYAINNLRFWSTQSTASDYLGSLSWAIYSDAASAPSAGAPLFSGIASPLAVAAGPADLGYSTFVFDIGVSFSLTAGNYWLALNNNPLNNSNPTEMQWAQTAAGATPTGKYLDGSTWIDTGNEHAFVVEGVLAVPEASTAAMFLAGLAACAALRKTRQSTDQTAPAAPHTGAL